MKWLVKIATISAETILGLISLAICFELLIQAAPLPDLSRLQAKSQLVTSSSGEVLWAFLTTDERWRFSATEDSVDPLYLRVLIAYEDKRFRSHRGVDLFAMVRAGIEAVRFGETRSGASTITMQVVRLLEPRPRTFVAKLEQILSAIKLERVFSKEQILNFYLTLAPFGGNIEGVRAASLIYFGKEPKHLTLAEAALLTALPQAPETRRPDRYPQAARQSRNRVLQRLERRGVIETAPANRARASTVALNPWSLTQNAPHVAMRLRQQFPADRYETIQTLIDAPLQKQVERIVSRAARRWSDDVSIAVIVLRNRDASIAAYVGGASLISEKRSGYVDLVQAIRSPGSTLKPLIYAMAFEKLIVHPETIITDEAVDFRGYRPENADGKFLGDMSVRQALIRSRNTTAVKLLDKVGVDVFLRTLQSAGRPLQLPSSTRAGLAVGLGGVGVTLEQLAWFYSAFANGGKIHSTRYKLSDPVQELGHLISPAAACAVADILGDVPSPPGFVRQRTRDGGRRIAFKTGTSYGFRDAWAVGFDQLHTVGVWIGRPDGGPHLGAYGATAAAPIMFEAFDAVPIPERDVASMDVDVGALSSYRQLPERLTRFDRPGNAGSSPPLEITFPRDGTAIVADSTSNPTVELPLAAAGGRPPYQWILSGVVQAPQSLPVTKWTVKSRGQLEISIIDAHGAVAKSSFWLE
jgi:penicillin-binding protein 1C